MKIVFVASEMRPFAATGGLADVISSLSFALARLGHDVKVFLPRYQKIDSSLYNLEKVTDFLPVPMGKAREQGGLFKMLHGDVELFFLDQPFYFNRPELYGTPEGDYEDNDRRFTFFNRGVLEALKKINYAPDIIHCHDWHAGLIPAYLKTLYKNEPLFQKTHTVFTIHNIAYQGNFPPDSFPVTGFPWSEYRFDRFEFWGKMSFLKGGLVYSDLLTTVSRQYAKELQTEEYGCGMEPTLKVRSSDLKGILNGIDHSVWDPEKDSEIYHRFSAKAPAGKAKNKEAIQKDEGFEVDPALPLFGFVGRFSSQKGLDLILPLLPELVKLRAQFVILGMGDAVYEKKLKDFYQKTQKTNKNFGIHISFNPALAKQIYAASDIFLMPSLFEPCGLGQMIAMRYGTVPLVRATGGLKETVQDFDQKKGTGNGIVFGEFTPGALLNAVKRAMTLYREKKPWAKTIANCFKADFSWNEQAKQYTDAYAALVKSSKPKKSPPSRGKGSGKKK